MTGFLWQICAAQRLTDTLSNEYHRLTQAHHHKALVLGSAAVDTTAARQLRRRRALRAQAAPFQRRRALAGSHSFNRILQRRLDMASHQEIRRRSSAADRAPVESHVAAMATTTSTFAQSPDFTSRPSQDGDRPCEQGTADTEAMPPPPLPQTQSAPSFRRHARAKSSISRHANRLSLTLPIAQPSSGPSRPTPTSATSTTAPSIPPTPVSAIKASPTNASEFITAIAAQERRVLELKEELARAESDLVTLKKQWSSKENSHRRKQSLQVESPRPVPAASSTEAPSGRPSAETDRRRVMFQDVSTPTGTPTQNRRRVLRGGHTRTLSLLSPPKTDISLPVPEEREPEALGLPMPRLENRANAPSTPNLSKRASWQPQQMYQNSPAMPQFVEEFKLGFRTFMEDIRQITVGEEPISGQASGSPSANQPSPLAGKDSPAGPHGQVRQRSATSAGETSPSNALGLTTPNGKSKEAAKEKLKAGKSKHFSWTPLGLESLEDNDDWSSWESPASTQKSARWSGSTMNSSGFEDMESVPEDEEDASSPSKPKPATTMVMSSPKLEELLPSVVNRLTPSNLHRTANNLMNEWEKSLIPPESRDKENSAA